MSVIIGYKTDGKVYMATDTQRSMGNYYYSDSTETGLNIFSLPHGIICGASNYLAKQIIKTHTEWFEKLADEPLTKKFIVQNIIPELYDSFDKAELIDEDKKKKGNPAFDGSILLAQKDRLFCIDDDFSVITVPEFCVIGSGADYAFARLATYKKEVPPELILYSAIADAQVWCKTVLKPYYLFSTDSTEKKLLGGDK